MHTLTLKNLSSDIEISSDKVTIKKSLKNITSLRGVFSKYADPSKIHLEDKAWEMQVVEKY